MPYMAALFGRAARAASAKRRTSAWSADGKLPRWNAKLKLINVSPGC